MRGNSKGARNGRVGMGIPHSRDTSPHGRDALTRAFARIGEEIANAKPRRGSGRRRGPQRPDRVGVKVR